MRNSTDVIAQVVNGKGPELAKVLEVSPSRCYEILSTDNPLPKAKRLIRAIAQVNPQGIALIQADLQAMFDELLGATDGTLTDAHRESSEAVQVELDGRPMPERIKEAREAVAAWGSRLRTLERENAAAVTVERFSKNGRGK